MACWVYPRACTHVVKSSYVTCSAQDRLPRSGFPGQAPVWRVVKPPPQHALPCLTCGYSLSRILVIQVGELAMVDQT